MSSFTLLAGDIGGVNARVAAFRLREDKLELLESVWLQSALLHSEAELFAAAKKAGLTLTPAAADLVVLAAAGPLEQGEKVSLTNAALRLDMPALRAQSGARHTLLMNDFAAQAYAVLSPVGQKLVPVLGQSKNQSERKANYTATAKPGKAVIGAGTGFGAAFVLPAEAEWLIMPTEYGQHGFAFTGKEEEELACFICRTFKQPYVRVDDILSGRGLSQVHAFLTGEQASPAEIGARVLQQESPTLNVFARLYARAARCMAFTSLCFGGLYITGGIAAKNPLLLECAAFQQEFYNCLTYADLLARMPVYHLKGQDSGLWGAAWAGRQFFYNRNTVLV